MNRFEQVAVQNAQPFVEVDGGENVSEPKVLTHTDLWFETHTNGGMEDGEDGKYVVIVHNDACKGSNTGKCILFESGDMNEAVAMQRKYEAIAASLPFETGPVIQKQRIRIPKAEGLLRPGIDCPGE